VFKVVVAHTRSRRDPVMARRVGTIQLFRRAHASSKRTSMCSPRRKPRTPELTGRIKRMLVDVSKAELQDLATQAKVAMAMQ
jgi:hypothetical protein